MKYCNLVNACDLCQWCYLVFMATRDKRLSSSGHWIET